MAPPTWSVRVMGVEVASPGEGHQCLTPLAALVNTNL